MKFRINTISAAILLATLSFGCQKEEAQGDIGVRIEQLVTEHDLPSLSACIFNAEGIQWSIQTGYADKENGILADKETIYHIGSISKLFIVTALMQMVEQGKLDIDEDINTYLPIEIRHPQFPHTPITSRMLLTHTAGISKPGTYDSQNGMWNLFDPDEGPSPSEWVPQYLVPDGNQYDPALWQSKQPGEYEIYSNIGTCVLAFLVEQLSNMNFRKYCKQYIFTPLDMNSTSYDYTDIDMNKLATMYSKDGFGSTYFDNRVYASGGAKSTPEDLSHFALCYLNKGVYDGTRILSIESVDAILKLQNPASGKCLLWNTYLGKWYGHTGGLEMGTSTTLTIHPESGTGLIIFTNAHEGTVSPGGDIFWTIRQKTNEYH